MVKFNDKREVAWIHSFFGAIGMGVGCSVTDVLFGYCTPGFEILVWLLADWGYI